MTVAQDFLTVQKYSRPGLPLAEARAIVMHWTAAPGQEPAEVRRYYESDEAAQEHYASSHAVVGTRGDVLQLIPWTERSIAVGTDKPDPASGKIYTDLARQLFPEVGDPWHWSPNPFTINVELCVLDWEGTFAPATLDSARELVGFLRRELGRPGLVVTTHNALVGWKDCPRRWVRHPEELVAWLGTLAWG